MDSIKKISEEKRPNIIIIKTDQQRYDTIGAHGFSYMRTPNIDRLVAEGTSFMQCYCTAPSCVPSRASFFNAKYPHVLDVYNNFCVWKNSWVELLQKEGYHTVNIGKMHTVPYDTPCGFDERFVVENKDRPLELEKPHGGFYDEWDRFLSNSGIRKPSREIYKAEHEEYETALGAYDWPLDKKYHPDEFVGNMAKWFIERRKSTAPLFLEIGFPGPHPPYDPPKQYVELYDNVDIPVPVVSEEELELQPESHRLYRNEMITGNHDAVKWHEKPSREQLLRLRRYYAANVTLIDEKIGEILEALEKRGYLDNAIVIFTSDHGDCLGDHGLIQKWTMYDCITRVPMIVRAPGRMPAGFKTDALIQHMDIASLLFELIGMEVPEEWDTIRILSDLNKGREYVFAEHSRDNILKGADFVTMIRNKRYKLVHYLDRDYGEFYDLEKDPGEIRNLWGDKEYSGIKQELLQILLNWRVQSSVKTLNRYNI